jgi:sortase B
LGFVVSVILFVFSCVWVVKIWIIDPYFLDRSVNNISSLYYSGSNEVNENLNWAKKFDSLTVENPDIKGWIKIENTVIDYPVLQSEPETPIFYLDHDCYKKKNANGSIFINASERFRPNLKNIVLHGHNLRSGRLFGALIKYEDLDFYKKSPVIEFNTAYGMSKWKIFSFFKTNTRPDQGEIFDYLRPKFNNNFDFLEFLYNLKIRSLIDIPVNLTSEDQILTLSTCSYEMKDFRTVVVARKVREGESSEVKVELAKKAKNPLWPDGWYRAKNLKKPEIISFHSALSEGAISWLELAEDRQLKLEPDKKRIKFNFR